MNSTRLVDTVIFDLGGVLMRNGGPMDLLARFGHHEQALRTVGILMGPYGEDSDHPWHRAERGEVTLAECRTATRAALAEAGIELPPAPSSGPAIVFERNEAMWALVADLRAAGIRTGVLTNNVREFRDAWWPTADYPSLFDDVVDSHEVGVRKPNPAIYTLALERLGATAHRSVFLDDIASNVAAAARVGMHAFQVIDEGHDAIRATRRFAGLEA